MIFKETRLQGAFIVEMEPIGDNRGFFARAWCQSEFKARGLIPCFVQNNITVSPKRGTLRGLHYQNPNPQGKLVRVTLGAVLDVAVDIRRGSPTFGRWVATELSAENKQALYVPPGFAHGFCVTSDVAEFVYKCTSFYDPACEHGILWSDPDLAIPWPVDAPIVSDRDRRHPALAAAGDALPTYP